MSQAQNGGHFEHFEILNIASIWPHIWKTSQIMPKMFSMVMTSSMTSQGGLKVSLYIHLSKRLAPVESCNGNVSSINANIVIVFLYFICQKTISMNNTFRYCRSKVNDTGLLGDLGTYMRSGGLIGWLFNWKCKFSCRISSNIANYLKYNFLCDGDGISNVMLRLWIFSDFCSRHIVGVAGDDIMFHILVELERRSKAQNIWNAIGYLSGIFNFRYNFR